MDVVIGMDVTGVPVGGMDVTGVVGCGVVDSAHFFTTTVAPRGVMTRTGWPSSA